MGASVADLPLDLGIVAAVVLTAAAVLVGAAGLRRSIRELAVTRSTAEAVVASATDAVVATDADGRIVTVWNPAAERLFGWPADDVVGHALPAEATARDAERDAILDRVRRGERVTVVTTRKHRDGHEVDVRIRYSALHDDHGRVAGIMGLVTDVTEERRRAERAELVERLAGVVGDLNADLETEAVLARIVSSAVALLGAGGASLVSGTGDHPTVMASAGTLGAPKGYRFDPGRLGLIADVPAGRPVVIGDYASRRFAERCVGPVGTLVAAPVRAAEELLGVLAVYYADAAHPVTPAELEVVALLAGHAATAWANARTYARTADARAHLQAVLDGLADGVAVRDRDGLVTGWNAAAATVTGLGAGDVLGAPLRWPAGDAEDPVLARVGDGHWVELAATPLSTGDGDVVILRDVSRHKALEQAKSVFLASTGHELKTPLTVVSGYARLLEQRWDSLGDDERRTGIEAIARKAAALGRTVEQIMLFSVAEAGRHDLDVRPVALPGVVADALAGVGATAPRHRLVVDVPADLPAVAGDRHRLVTVVSQLVENAVKYSPEGGDVTVAASVEGDEVVVTVDDDGVGIDPARSDALFDRFTRGAPDAAAGVGLGLSIVRSMVEAHGGRVWADGAPGEGARFSFSLPLAG